MEKKKKKKEDENGKEKRRREQRRKEEKRAPPQSIEVAQTLSEPKTAWERKKEVTAEKKKETTYCCADALAVEPAADEDDLEEGDEDVDGGFEEGGLDDGVVRGVVDGLVVGQSTPLPALLLLELRQIGAQGDDLAGELGNERLLALVGGVLRRRRDRRRRGDQVVVVLLRALRDVPVQRDDEVVEAAEGVGDARAVGAGRAADVGVGRFGERVVVVVRDFRRTHDAVEDGRHGLVPQHRRVLRVDLVRAFHVQSHLQLAAAQDEHRDDAAFRQFAPQTPLLFRPQLHAHRLRQSTAQQR
mmetsp:Transcript_13066/g.39487  ORF Transcript_13066/g.39487 Transcript_13066/m.39487 type:complete len:300 (-) Transcript_13066:88-987(-)